MLFKKSHLKIYGTTLALALTIVISVWGQEKPNATGSIEGSIKVPNFSAESGMAISGYAISAYKETSSGAPEVVYSSSTSDVKGSFVLQNLPLDSSYTIRVKPIDSAESAPPVAEKRGIKLTPDNPTKKILMDLPRFTYFVVELLQGNNHLNGEVLLDDEMYGKTQETLITLVGMHKLSAKSNECVAEERQERLSTRAKEDPYKFMLKCKK